MMRVMSSTPSPAVAAPDWAHTYFWAFYIIFWSFWEAHDFLKQAQSQRIKLLYCFIVPWGHPEGVSQTLIGPIMCFIYFLLSGLPFYG